VNSPNNIRRIQRIISLILFVLLSVLFYQVALGYKQAKYTESAHGNNPAGVGVKRTGVMDFGYATGNCVYCHEQHASIGGSEPAPTGGPDNYLLFAPAHPISQTNNFCFQCHQGVGSLQYGGIPYANNDYGSQFGGGLPKATNNIKDTFALGPPAGISPASSHNLEYLRNWWRNQIGGDWVTDNTNACEMCHDPHYSQSNHDPYPPSPPYRTAIRRPNEPSSGQNKPRNLWGDELNSDAAPEREIMSEYTTFYQAPLRSGGYEPAGNSTHDGSNLPNFDSFCIKCHGKTIGSNKTDAIIGSRSSLYVIEWDNVSTADRHGKNGTSWHSTTGGAVKSPYIEGQAGGYVLSCTDCHEPHGSSNPYLLRTCVNGTDGITVTASVVGSTVFMRLYNLCAACHTLTAHAAFPFNSDTDCFQNGACHFHGGAF
jgi:cytochrome c553